MEGHHQPATKGGQVGQIVHLAKENAMEVVKTVYSRRAVSRIPEPSHKCTLCVVLPGRRNDDLLHLGSPLVPSLHIGCLFMKVTSAPGLANMSLWFRWGAKTNSPHIPC